MILKISSQDLGADGGKYLGTTIFSLLEKDGFNKTIVGMVVGIHL